MVKGPMTMVRNHFKVELKPSVGPHLSPQHQGTPQHTREPRLQGHAQLQSDLKSSAFQAGREMMEGEGVCSAEAWGGRPSGLQSASYRRAVCGAPGGHTQSGCFWSGNSLLLVGGKR